MSLPKPVAYACLALSMSLVGSYVALSKPLALVFPVFLLGWLRFGIGGLAILPWLKKPPEETPLLPQTKRLVFLGAFLGNFLFSICMLFGVSLSSAVAAGVIMAAIPAVVALLSWLFLKETISLRVWGAVLCAMGGITLLALGTPAHHGGASGQTQSGWGFVLLFGAVLCEASYVVIGKKLTGSLGPKRITALFNGWGWLLMTPFGLYYALSFDFAAVSMGSWILLLFYALAASVWTVWLWMTGLKSIPASQGGVFTVMLPIAACLVGVGVLDETLSGLQMIALVLALLGVILATLPGRKQTSIHLESADLFTSRTK